MPPPQQKPTAPTLPFDSAWAARNGTAAAIRATVAVRSSAPIISRALSSSAGVPPPARERVHREGQEALDGHAPRHVLDVRVQAAVLVDHEHRRALAAALQPGEVAVHARAGRVVADGLGGEPRVVLVDDRRVRVVVLEHGQERGGGRGTAAELRQALEQLAPAHGAVRELVVQVDHPLVHRGPSREDAAGESTVSRRRPKAEPGRQALAVAFGRREHGEYAHLPGGESMGRAWRGLLLACGAGGGAARASCRTTCGPGARASWRRSAPRASSSTGARPTRVYSRDVDYEYRQDSDLLYLTGIDQDGTTLVLLPGNKTKKSILFVSDADPRREHRAGPPAHEAGGAGR